MQPFTELIWRVIRWGKRFLLGPDVPIQVYTFGWEFFRPQFVSREARIQCWRGCLLGSLSLALAHLTTSTLLNQTAYPPVLQTAWAVDVWMTAERVRLAILAVGRPMMIIMFACLFVLQFEKAPSAFSILASVLAWMVYPFLVLGIILLVCYNILLIVEHFVVGAMSVFAVLAILYAWAKLPDRWFRWWKDHWGHASGVENFLAAFVTALFFLLLLLAGG